MSGPVRVLEDGTRIYANGVRYRPVPDSERKHKIRKPDNPRAVRWYGKWIILPELVQDAARVMPETRPDTDAYEHWMLNRRCRCEVCSRPESKRWREKGSQARYEGQLRTEPR